MDLNMEIGYFVLFLSLTLIIFGGVYYKKKTSSASLGKIVTSLLVNIGEPLNEKEHLKPQGIWLIRLGFFIYFAYIVVSIIF